MTSSADDTGRWLAAARAGSREALGQMLEGYRAFLLLIAQRELDPDLRAKGGASDLVQESFLEAQRDFAQFRGDTEAELLGWLQQILRNNVASFSRRFRETAKRRLACEISLEAAPAGQQGLGQGLAAPGPSPLEQAIDQEQDRLLAQALERLPEDYQQALLLRFRENQSFEEIGRMLHRSPNAARKLWLRAVERLQEEMGQSSERGTR